MESKLKKKLGKHKTDDTKIDDIGFAISKPMIQNLDQSIEVIQRNIV